jgi:hypothetical protein
MEDRIDGGGNEFSAASSENSEFFPVFQYSSIPSFLLFVVAQ